MSKRMNDYNQGWIEAMIDGEGSLSLIKERRPQSQLGCTFVPILFVGSNDKVLIDRVFEIIGEGSIRHYKGESRKNTLWAYTLHSNGLRRFLPKVTFLIKEKQRTFLLEALNILKGRNGGQGRWHRDPNGGKQLTEIWKEMRRLNRPNERT